VRERKDVQVGIIIGGRRLVALVIANRRPQERVAQQRGKNIEHGRLVFAVLAAVIGIIAQHEEHIRCPIGRGQVVK